MYEIIGSGRALSDDDYFIRIRVVESGEDVDARLTDILDAPRER